MDGLLAELDALTGSPKGYVRFIDATDYSQQFLARIDAISDSTGYWEVDITRLNGATSFTLVTMTVMSWVVSLIPSLDCFLVRSEILIR